MKLLAPFIKTVTAYDSGEWEVFIREWATSIKPRYLEVKRMGGAGDMGRDVVGFCDNSRFEGIWDNYQCKHLIGLLQPSKAAIDIAKIIYFSFKKHYVPPRRCWFVAPRGVSSKLRDLLGAPSKLREYVLENWDGTWSSDITDTAEIKLEGGLRTYAEAFDFTIFGWYTPDELLEDHKNTAYWSHRFGGMLPPPPRGLVPPDIVELESVYIGELLHAYSDKLGREVKGPTCLEAEADLKVDLQRQRERFFDAEAFTHTYRDQTAPGTIEDFVDQIHFAVEPIVNAKHENGFERLCRTLAHAGSVPVASILSGQAKPQVKQGVCHQLTNSKRIRWVKK